VIDRIVSVLTLVTQSAPALGSRFHARAKISSNTRPIQNAGAGGLEHLVLPAITLGLGFMAMVTRLTRSGLLEVINEGYVQTARAKGLSERVVIFPHAIRNALIPIVTVIGLYFGTVLGGTVVIETVFSWPGVGRLIADSIGFRDYAVVQAGIITIAAIFVFVNLVVDVLYAFLDPRVRLGE
jgi:peptide/nickel transport system permease protein